MAYVNFKNSPSEETPLTGGATGNLNVMQENGTSHGTDTKLGYAQSFLNEHIINVSNEVDEDYRVNFIKGKNLFNLNDITNGYYLDDNGQPQEQSNSWYTNYYIKVEPNTNYTFSGGGTAKRVCYYQSNKTFISRTTSTNASYTITTPNNCYYVRISNANSTSNVQFEKGSTATTYEPYNRSIYVDNEEIYSKPSVRDYYKDITLNTTNVSINSNNLHYYKKRSDGLIVFTITLSAKVAMTSGNAYDLFTIPSDVNPSSNFPYIVGSYNKGYGVAYIQSQTRLMRFKPFQNLAIGDEIHLTGCYYQS